jgi:hypothetical protein
VHLRSRRLPPVVRAAGPVGAVLAVDLIAGAALFHRLLVHPATTTLDSGHSDPGLFIWWLRWAPFAVGHGLDPLYTHYWNAPHGIDAMWNTSVLAIGLLLSPVTLLFGAVATYNVAGLLGPVLSAFAATMFLRRHTGLLPAAIGGLVFGFSPFEVQQANGHIHLTWLVLVPVMAILLEEIGWRSARPWIWAGPVLGLVVAVQWFISTEVVVIAAISAAIALVALAVRFRDQVVERWRPALLGLVSGAVVAALLLIVPLLNQYGSANVIDGPVQPVNRWQSRLAFLFDAPATLQLHTAAGAAAAFARVGYENGMYVGIPLLILLVLAVGRLWRRPGVIPAAATVVVLFVLSLGGAGPWRWVEDGVHPLRNLLPLRFAIGIWLAIAFLVASALDAALDRARGPVRIGAVVVIAGCLVPLLPASIGRVGGVDPVPSFFTTSDVDVIPSGANVLLVPAPVNESNAGFLWQVESGMRFAQPASLALRPAGPGRLATFAPEATGLVYAFADEGPGPHLSGPVTAGQRATVLAELARSRVRAVVMSVEAGGPGRYEALESVFGRAPDLVEGGVDLWWVTGSPGHSLR